MASLLSGLAPVVQITRSDPHCSDFHLHGFQRLTPKTTFCAVVISLSSWVAESFLHLVMQDDRLARHAGEAWSQCVSELDFVMQLPEAIWQLLVDLVDDPEKSLVHLRDATIQASLISLGFLHFTVFHLFGQLPWRLTQGNAEEQLVFLERLDSADIRDSCSRRIRRLLEVGYDQDALRRVYSYLLSRPGRRWVSNSSTALARRFTRSILPFRQRLCCSVPTSMDIGRCCSHRSPICFNDKLTLPQRQQAGLPNTQRAQRSKKFNPDRFFRSFNPFDRFFFNFDPGIENFDCDRKFQSWIGFFNPRAIFNPDRKRSALPSRSS